MSKDDVKAEILDPMQRLYEPPRGCANASDKAKVLQDYIDSLSRYSAEVLRSAWRQMRETHTRATWPPISAILLECRRTSPAPTARTFDQQRAEEDRLFLRFCESRGLNPRLMRRPNYWWRMPRDQWRPEWKESEVPIGHRPNMRRADGTLVEDVRIAEPHYAEVG